MQMQPYSPVVPPREVRSAPAQQPTRSPYVAVGGSSTPRPPSSRPQHAPPATPRRSKADSLRLVHQLKQGIVVAAVLGFGMFGALAAGHQSVTHATATSSDTSNSASQPSSGGSFFTQQPGGSDSGNFGSSSTGAAPVTGSASS